MLSAGQLEAGEGKGGPGEAQRSVLGVLPPTMGGRGTEKAQAQHKYFLLWRN